ncbi:MAG: hypothetical protein ACYDDA_05155, partial [Acidiferrobacteraceae bacterium]
FATKSTSLGQRLFAPENTARDVRAMSASYTGNTNPPSATNPVIPLPAITVAPGVGLPGLTGYGKANDRQHGAGCACNECKPVSSQQPPAQTPTANPPANAPFQPATNVATGLTGAVPPQGNFAVGAQGAPAEKTNIIAGRFDKAHAPAGRFTSKRFG